MNFARAIATRYLTRRQGLFAFITTLIGVAGVSVGVAALITTLSVMNGYQRQNHRRAKPYTCLRPNEPGSLHTKYRKNRSPS